MPRLCCASCTAIVENPPHRVRDDDNRVPNAAAASDRKVYEEVLVVEDERNQVTTQSKLSQYYKPIPIKIHNNLQFPNN